MSLEQKQSLETLRQLLHWQNRDIAKLNTLLDWASTHVLDFPPNGTFPLEAWQAVGQTPLDNARIGDADACRHLVTWGIIMAVLNEPRMQDRPLAASVTDSPEPSDSTSPTSDTPGDSEVMPNPVVLFDCDENPDPVGLLDPIFLDPEKGASLYPPHDSDDAACHW